MNEKKAWDISYKNKDNFVFYPHEEVIRFVSKFITKMRGFDDFEVQHGLLCPPKLLDLGCGIGRHVKFAYEYGLDGYGVDLSSTAIESGRKIFIAQGLDCLVDKLTVGNCTALEYEDNIFDFAVSHGVLDSMPFETAKLSILELSRCMKSEGLAYIDLISGDDYKHHAEYCEEEVVNTEHEKDTIQSYFNWTKILQLFGDKFEIIDAKLVKSISLTSSFTNARYHLVVKNIK